MNRRVRCACVSRRGLRAPPQSPSKTRAAHPAPLDSRRHAPCRVSAVSIPGLRSALAHDYCAGPISSFRRLISGIRSALSACAALFSGVSAVAARPRLRQPQTRRLQTTASPDPAGCGSHRPGGMQQPQTRRDAAATDPAGSEAAGQAAVSPAPCFAKLSSGTRLRPASSLGPGLFSWARPLLLAHSCVSVAPETRPGRLSPADAVRIAKAATAAATATQCQDRSVP